MENNKENLKADAKKKPSKEERAAARQQKVFMASVKIFSSVDLN